MTPDHDSDTTSETGIDPTLDPTLDHDPDHDPDLDLEAMIHLAGQVLGEHLPVHKVDQMLASMRDLVEFTVVLHDSEANLKKEITMWSTDAAEAAHEARRVFAVDGWHISRITRDCTECFGDQWWLNPDGPIRPLPFSDEEMWGTGMRGKVNKALGESLFRIGHRLNRVADRAFALADRIGR